MKEEILEQINRTAKEYFEENCSPWGEPNYENESAFKAGAEWMHSQYGVSPDTVKEMLRALKSASLFMSDLQYDNQPRGLDRWNEIITKVEQELNKK